MRELLILFCILLLSVLDCPAQLLNREQQLTIPDSFNYVTAVDLYDSTTAFIDSLDPFFHRYDPAKDRPFPYLHLGNLGSAARPALFDPVIALGFDPGYHQYDLYKHRIQDFRFFTSDVSLSDLKYSQGIAQDDGIFNARFRRSFAEGAHMSIDYLRINQIGQFAHQRAGHTGFGVGLFYHAPSGKYKGLFLYQSNSIMQEDNGGVVDYRLLDSAMVPLGEPGIVYLLGAMTETRERKFTMQHHFPLLRKPDSIAQEFHLDIFSNSSFGSDFYRFSDNLQSVQDDYYAGFVTDDRGLRNYVFDRFLNNALYIQGRKSAASGNEGASLRLIAGLEHKYFHVEAEPEKFYLNEFYFHGKGFFNWAGNLQLQASTKLGLFDAAENFLLEGTLNVSLGKAGDLEAEAMFFQRQPSLLEGQLYVTQKLYWKNNFNNPFYQRLGLKWNLEKLKLELAGRNYLLSNHILFGPDKTPFQLANTESVLQLSAMKELHFGPMGLNTWLAFQLQSVESLSLPEWVARIQLYYAGTWFRDNLQIRIGLDYGNLDDYGAIGYFPLTGQFYNKEGMIRSYHDLDFFASFQVRFFRAFVMLQNISSFVTDDIFEQIDDYPQFTGYFRFGLNMRLFD